MPYLIILLSLFAFSCKNDNHIKGPNPFLANQKREALETSATPDMSIEEESTPFRQKILNGFVESKLDLLAREELGGVSVDGSYAEKERAKTKLIVSYTDHTDIYFLERGVLLEKAVKELNLIPENDRTFKWLNNIIVSKASDSTVILASVNLNDIVMNDRNFFQKKVVIDGNQKSVSFDVPNGAVAEGILDYKMFVQNESVATKIINRMAKYEYSCIYHINEPAAGFSEASRPDLFNIGLEFKMDNQTFGIDRFSPDVDSQGMVSFKIDPSEVHGQSFKAVLSNNFDQSFVKNVESDVAFNVMCGKETLKASYELKRNFQFKMEIVVKGRGFEKLKNVL